MKEQAHKNKLKKLPKFKIFLEEKIFWECHNSVSYIDWSKARKVQFVNLKPGYRHANV